MKNSDLWIFGDSFSDYPAEFDDNWVCNTVKKFNGKNYYKYAAPGRDIQTIMDLFYKNICNIKENSLVLIFLPVLDRIRYPKNKKFFKDFLETFYNFTGENCNFNFNELFFHWPYKDYPNGNAKDELDFPFNCFDYKKLNDESVIHEFKNWFADTDANKFNISPIDFFRLLNHNEATMQNWNDIFFSLTNSFNFKVVFFSWTDLFDDKLVWTKKKITQEIGFWHTEHDYFIETNGKCGKENDNHFSKKMHKAFSKFVIKKYPIYFV